MPRYRHRGEHPLDKAARVNPGDVVDLGFGGLAPLEASEFGRVERLQHRPQPGRRFRVVIARVMIEAGGMGEKQRRHGWRPSKLLWKYGGTARKRYGSSNALRARCQLASSGAQISPPLKCVG